MIRGAFLHYRGLGPVKVEQLRQGGIETWDDLAEKLPQLNWSPALSKRLLADCQLDCDAADRDDIAWFCKRFNSRDQWRILARWFPRASFFDIETDGTGADAIVTCIGVWHRGKLHNFIENDFLEGFLDLLEDVELLVSFNGASFDVPRVLDRFRIPALPCPHVDLRWICHHHGLTGGLKSISHRLACPRPGDLDGADGALAVELWHQWQYRRDTAARDLLVRYCAADVVLTRLVAARLLTQAGAPPPPENEQLLWDSLPVAPPVSQVAPHPEHRRPVIPRFFLRRGR